MNRQIVITVGENQYKVQHGQAVLSAAIEPLATRLDSSAGMMTASLVELRQTVLKRECMENSM